MIRINQIKLPVTHTHEQLRKKAAKLLRIPEEKITKLVPVRRSIDARRKNDIHYTYTVDVEIPGNEETAVRKAADKNISVCRPQPYRLPAPGSEKMCSRPVIVGFGPAGMFCGLMLAKAGYRPLILERGEQVEKRAGRVEKFWTGNALSTESNIQFGEGGAGTFSDGKLNTLVKDPAGRNRKVLEILAEAGADPEILYVNNPHVGTDVLRTVVKNIREEILRLGGEIRFGCKMDDFSVRDGHVSGVLTERGGIREEIPADVLVLALGHSARDTFAMLDRKNLNLQPKAFAVGLRIQHPQRQINLSQYGMEEPGVLGAASYKVTRQTSFGRGVYSFCMCPGGYVVNASSEEGRLAVNGMSNHGREGENANSALIVTVTPEDFPDQTALGGVAFQRHLEEAAYRCGNGRIPVQLLGDFRENRISAGFGDVSPAFKGLWSFGNLRDVLPDCLSLALLEGVDGFGRMIRGFDRSDAILAGVESRTSSPLRIPRNERFEGNVAGVYPCGEGAGYAGGITSAAMDGMKIAEAVISRFRPV